MITTAISTDRLKLRILSLADAPALFAYASNPKVAENTAWIAHQYLMDSEAFIQHTINRHSEQVGALHLVWAILLHSSQDMIGTISFNQDQANSGHIDYAIGESFWAQGYTTEAVKALVKWLFINYPQIDLLKSGCLSRNIGSIRVLEKAGFQVKERYTRAKGGKFKGQVLETTTFFLPRNTDASASHNPG